MLNVNQTVQNIVSSNLTDIQTLKRIGEIFLPSFLIFWLSSIVFIIIIGFLVLKRDQEKIFIIAIIPLLIIGVLILLFTFIVPFLPNMLGDVMKDMLG